VKRDTKTIMREFRDLLSDMVALGAFTLDEIEQAARFEFVKSTLERYVFNQSRAARRLDVHRNTVRRYLVEMEKAGVELAKKRQPRSAAVPAKGRAA
jgi:ActR/RegA family two-component response regulator